MSGLLSFEAALAAIQDGTSIRVQSEELPLIQALGRIAAQDIVASLHVPPHDNSAMDGYALSMSDWQAGKIFTVSQRIAAGQAPTPLKVGTCARIFTGANIPAGADCVIMQENASVTEEGVVFINTPQSGENIRPKGQDIESGQTVVTEGSKLTAMHIGLLSSLGITHVSVYQKLKVGVLTTGDELIPAGEPLQEGQIHNSNGPMLCALIAQAGHHVESCLHSPDTPEDTQAAIESLMKNCDVILSSGGVSVGEEDHVKNVLESLGTLHLWKIAIKPGKPLVHATLNGVPFLGLPGNPSSTLVTFHWFARLLLSACAGQSHQQPKAYSIKAGFTRDKSIKRDEFLRVSIDSDGYAHPHAQQSSGALLAACESDGYLRIKAGSSIEKNQSYEFYPFSGF